MGASNAGGVGRNRDGFTACCHRCDRQVLSTRRRRTVASCDTYRPFAGSKRRSLLMTGDDDEMFMTKSLNVTPKTTEQHCYYNCTQLIVHINCMQ